MKSLFIVTDKDEILARINKLTPDTQHLWGKMNVCQMLVHCQVGVESAIGDRYMSRTLMGKLIGRFFKSMATNNRSFGQGSPTHPDFIIGNTEEFSIEKDKLTALVQRMYDGGKHGATGNPHAFFGHLTPTEWGALMYKHIDHHLKQFGA